MVLVGEIADLFAFLKDKSSNGMTKFIAFTWQY